MRPAFLLRVITGISTIVILALSDSFGAQPAPAAVRIPKSMQVEHQEIHTALTRATQEEGRVGAAAKELAQVLEPHFKREEQIALPPLGLLGPLAAGETVPEAAASEALKMSAALKAELPRMLDEHKRIRAAVEKLRAAARAEKAAEYERLAEALALHAQTEEEVMYPAAVLVGDLLRVRQQAK